MEVTLEQVERLREKADVSYSQAKEALAYSEGNLLDALIYLEEQGVIPRPEGTCYSTRSEVPPIAGPILEDGRQKAGQGETGPKRGIFQRVRCLLLENELEVWRKDRPVTALPVLILIILLIAAYMIVIPMVVLSLFFGFRYRFSGPDLERDGLNHVMGGVADTAADLGRQVMDELRSQHEKYSGGKDNGDQ